MSLGNFFTLTEMNDGLTAPSRVRELVAVMQKGRDCTMNVADAIRQWSAVARTIAATETKDCLDLFIQLDGLQFIDKWLKDAQKFSNETDDSFMEESISHLLQALQRLPVDKETLVSSNISATVKDFLGHNSSKVLDTARALLDSWEKDLAANDTQITEMGRESRQESLLGGALISRESTVEEKCQQSTNDHPGPPTNFSVLEPDNVESAPISDRIFDHPVMNDKTSDHVGSLSSSRHANESEPFVRQGEQTVLNDLESADDVMRITKTESSPEKVDLPDESKQSGDQSSTSEAADASGSAMESSLQKLSGAKEKVGPKSSSSADVRTTSSDGKDAVDGGGLSVQRRNSDAQTKENAELDTILRNSTTSEKSWKNLKNSSTFLLKVEDEGGTKKLDRHDSDGSKSRATGYKFGKSKTDRKPDVTNKKSMVELDYGILDPLEVARQVAMEVRDLVDFREQSCSSSEKSAEGKLQEPDSPEISSGKGSHASEGSLEEANNYPDMSTEASPMQEEFTSSNENLGAAEPINNAQDVETSQVTEVAQEEANTTKGLCNFDLNQEVHSEDTNFPVNQISATVTAVSASRASAASGFPAAPLQFEGTFGWKGSATSAFRPASPRRISEGDKDLSTGESSSSSKQRQGCLDIDLNIAESEDGRIEDLPNKEVPVSSTIISGESLVDTNSRSERVELDLNRASEDGDIPSEWQINGQLFPKRNSHQSQTLSSSASLKQPSLRNIDLNDQPSFLNDNSDHSHLTNLPRNLNAPGQLRSDDSVISILGTRVEVKRRDDVPHTLPLPNGKTPELAFDVNLSSSTGSFLGMGSAPPYPQSMYNFNGISPGHALPYPTLYGAGGPIPYMVDSRGAPVVPHIVGSTSALPSPFSQPPFLVGMTSSTPSNGIMPSQGSFDLDSRLMLEGTSRGPTGMGLLPNSGPFMSTGEHLRYYSQPSISSVGEKRKEPDGGWDYYPKYYNSHGRPFLG